MTEKMVEYDHKPSPYDVDPKDYAWRGYLDAFEYRKNITHKDSEHFYPAVGALIRRHRQQKGFSAQQLSREIAIDESVICQYETGKRVIPVFELMLICRYLKISFHLESGFFLYPEEKLLLDHLRQQHQGDFGMGTARDVMSC